MLVCLRVSNSCYILNAVVNTNTEQFVICLPLR
jgi:hypothetical protein